MKSPKAKRNAGMTLMESVIAIGVISFAVPLILGATTNSMNDRRNAECDTRSAWLAKNVQDQIASRWAVPAEKSYLPETLELPFPQFASETDPIVLVYDNDASFVGAGNGGDVQNGSKAANAQYLVTMHAVPQTSTNLGATNQLSRILVKVQYPAKAPLSKRLTSEFTFVSPKQTL